MNLPMISETMVETKFASPQDRALDTTQNTHTRTHTNTATGAMQFFNRCKLSCLRLYICTQRGIPDRTCSSHHNPRSHHPESIHVASNHTPAPYSNLNVDTSAIRAYGFPDFTRCVFDLSNPQCQYLLYGEPRGSLHTFPSTTTSSASILPSLH